jgi:sulfite oxidase
LVLSLAPFTREKDELQTKINSSSVASSKLLRVEDELPVKLFSRSDVSKHNSRESIWISYQDGVYDITEFVKIHPGGIEKIFLAAGLPIDPFWDVFSIHKTPETFELLQNYRIGSLIPLDKDESAKFISPVSGINELFSNEPRRDPALLVRSARPCNAESPPSALLEHSITPNPLFYVRNHLPVPKMDAERFELEIEGPGIPEGFKINLDDLKKFPKVTLEATLQCAGNRRIEMHEIKPVKGLLWKGGAISNTTWTGARLSDVLTFAGFPLPDFSNEDYHDVEHCCFNAAEGYGASIPIQKALDPRGDVILAYEMNGEDIPVDHGFPLRALVPGHVAARSVKWVNKIALTDYESDSHWQQLDYKGFSPSKNLTNSDYSKSESIQELPIQSAILYPSSEDMALIKDGNVTVKGYAFSGGGRSINRVDVSVDGGKTWTDAVLDNKEIKKGRDWSWTKWDAEVSLPESASVGGEIEIVCKAVDSSYNVQPDSYGGIYNARGVLVNAWQRVKVKTTNK